MLFTTLVVLFVLFGRVLRRIRHLQLMLHFNNKKILLINEKIKTVLRLGTSIGLKKIRIKRFLKGGKLICVERQVSRYFITIK